MAVDPPGGIRPSLLEGIDRFNAGRFWDAHESWERLWLVARDPEKLFIQGLIQLAAAFHHVQRRNWTGAVRLLEAARAKLAPYPDAFLGLDLRAVMGAAGALQARFAAALEANAEPSIEEGEIPPLTLRRPEPEEGEER